MIDEKTGKPMRVSSGGTAGPCIMVRVHQLPEVVALLEKHKIFHWVDETAVSLNGQPAVTFIEFRTKTPGQQVQDILDSVP